MKHKHKKRRQAKHATTALVKKPGRGQVVLVAAPQKKHKRRKRSTRKRHMAMPPALAAWHRAHGGHHKRKTKTKTHHKRRRRGPWRRAARRHGRRAGGLLRRLLPTVPEAVSIGTAALYGKVEGDAAKDANHVLRKVPAPLVIIGRSGNIGLGAWILGALINQPLVRAAANGIVDVAAYQLLRRPEAYGKGGDADVDFKLGGMGYRGARSGAAPQLVDRYVRGNGCDTGDGDGDDDDDDDDDIG